MITAFTVKNFKAIGDDPVRIELKPITLLFGANSAGKSSILHALNYADVIFNYYSHNVDDKTLSDDDRLNLGGFKRFIHGRDPNRNLVLRFDLDFIVDKISDMYLLDLQVGKFYDSKLHPKKLLSSATSAYVEIEVSWSSIRQYAYVSRYETGINGERIAAVYTKPDVKGGAVRYFNTAHSVFSNYWIEHGISLDCLVEKCLLPNNYNRKSVIPEEKDVQYNECETPQDRRKVFERLGRVPSTAFILSPDIYNINLMLDHRSILPRALCFSPLDKNNEINDEENSEIEYSAPSAFDLQNLLKVLLVVPGEMVGNWLNSMRYLGPLREIPPRNFIGFPFDFADPTPWTKGLAAWNMLYCLGKNQLDESADGSALNSFRLLESSDDLIKTVNNWLASDQRLNTGYKVVIERYREVSSDDPIFSFITGINKPQGISELINQINRLPEKIRVQLEDKSCGLKLEPHEIGTGISQVLPVIVAAINQKDRFLPNTKTLLVAIEQPELHVHPAVQVQLGDLFITQFITQSDHNNKSFLIETHSEHLLLRILRRINETYENKLPPDIKPCTPDDIAIYYLEKESQGLRIRRLEISEDGDSKGDWPEGFFEERRAELF